ncbi:MAG: hypothetical protein ACOC5A_03215 [Halanaerobiales bacterium]
MKKTLTLACLFLLVLGLLVFRNYHSRWQEVKNELNVYENEIYHPLPEVEEDFADYNFELEVENDKTELDSPFTSKLEITDAEISQIEEGEEPGETDEDVNDSEESVRNETEEDRVNETKSRKVNEDSSENDISNEEESEEETDEKKIEAPGFKVIAIVRYGKKSLANINDGDIITTVAPGDSINGFIVEDIKQDQVVFTKEEATFKLSVNE